MKRIICALLAVLMLFAFAACTNTGDTDTTQGANSTGAPDVADVKVGFIFLHDENSTYDKNFM
ncbi:MAG: hypothetical protein ACI4GZ_06800, partial [Ruminococcus sp.]